MTIAFHTLGCKVNQYDTQAMRELFERAGWQSRELDDACDAYVINTCTVTGTGDKKSLQLIRRIHREHPNAAIVVAGCLAQRDVDAVSLPGVALVIGTQRRAEVVELTARALADGAGVSGKSPLIAVNELRHAAFEPLSVNSHEGHTRAVMKIQEGCDRYCSYCVIPYVRGPVRSMALDDVRAEAARLACAGYRELVITGIHLASYGRGMGCELTDAVSAAAENGGVRRVRIGSLEPVYVTRERAARLAEIPELCHQFHLSMQSGSAGVLARMNRRYTPEQYRAAAEYLREYMPGCALTTDVLTGFPGETDAEAQQTYDFVREMKFARIHVFPYSRRTGTRAADMPDQVPEHVKHERAAALIALGTELSREYARGLVGTTREVLFETEESDETLRGYTRTYVPVLTKRVPDARLVPGEIANVSIESERDGELYGRPQI